jgi:hypothetical protein
MSFLEWINDIFNVSYLNIFPKSQKNSNIIIAIMRNIFAIISMEIQQREISLHSLYYRVDNNNKSILISLLNQQHEATIESIHDKK